MHVANTTILKLQVFSGRSHLRLWVFASTEDYFTTDTEKYCQGVRR